MSLQSLIESLEAKAKTLETNIASTLANYHGLTGILAGIKDALAEAQKIVSVIAPGSAITEVINGLESAINVVDALNAPSPVQEDVPQ